MEAKGVEEMRIKRNKYDITFSQYIKQRDVCCQWCGRTDGALQTSHIYSRRHTNTRWDPRNAKLLCFACHQRWHSDPIEGFEWLKSVIGADRLEQLRKDAHKVVKLTTADKDEIRASLMDTIDDDMECFNPEFDVKSWTT